MMAERVRDARTMNGMDPETKAIHVRLEVWGAWTHENTGAWPSTTVLGKLIECGPQGAAQQGRPPVSMPDDVAATDAAVARLNEKDRKAVILYYTKWEPIEVAARRLKCNVRHFRRTLQRARWRLSVLLESRA